MGAKPSYLYKTEGKVTGFLSVLWLYGLRKRS
jgi:hypothetical protein